MFTFPHLCEVKPCEVVTLYRKGNGNAGMIHLGPSVSTVSGRV